VAGVATLVAVWVRLHNAFSYPADWGFDAAANWQYIHALTRTWTLPPPDAGWSTGDPPLYFYVSASVLRAIAFRPVLIPLLNVVLGLVLAGLAGWLVRDRAPEDGSRAVLATLLVLYLPAHVQMSAMVNEELLSAVLTSFVVLTLARPAAAGFAGGLARPAAAGFAGGLARPAVAGFAGGLALLTKLSGALSLGAAALTYAWEGWRSRRAGPAAARIAVLSVAALLAGGWFYLRNRWLYGFFVPFGMPAHELMFGMPPGERELLDYLRVPLATFTDPQLLNPDLLRSVWGSTYASVWFDAHRFFLPTASPAVRRLGTLTLLLALLPTTAFAVGLARGARRCLRGDGRADVPLVALVALTLAGYALYAWQNPWFVVLKGTSLLGLALPYACYASEVLVDWARRGRSWAIGIGAALAALAVCVAISGTFNGLFERTEVSGIRWETTNGR
jgi:hypothetical protein